LIDFSLVNWVCSFMLLLLVWFCLHSTGFGVKCYTGWLLLSNWCYQ